MLRVADMMMRCPYLPLSSYLSAISLLDSVMPIGLHNQLAILTPGVTKAYTAAVVTACQRADMMVSILMKMCFNDKGGSSSSSSKSGHGQRDQARKTNKSRPSTTEGRSSSTASSTKKKASKKSNSSKMHAHPIDPTSLMPEGWPAWLFQPLSIP